MHQFMGIDKRKGEYPVIGLRAKIRIGGCHQGIAIRGILLKKFTALLLVQGTVEIYGTSGTVAEYI